MWCLFCMQLQESAEAEIPMQRNSPCAYLHIAFMSISLVVPLHAQSLPHSICEVLGRLKRQGADGCVQVFDYIVNAVKRTSPSIKMVDDEDMASREDFSSWEWLVLNICEVCLASCADIVGIAFLQELFLLLASSAMYRRISALRINFLGSKVLPHMLAMGMLCLRRQLLLRSFDSAFGFSKCVRSSAECRLHPCWRSSWRGCTFLIQS